MFQDRFFVRYRLNQGYYPEKLLQAETGNCLKKVWKGQKRTVQCNETERRRQTGIDQYYPKNLQ